MRPMASFSLHLSFLSCPPLPVPRNHMASSSLLRSFGAATVIRACSITSLKASLATSTVISPQYTVHVLVIPKSRDGLTRLRKAEERHVDVLSRLLYAAKIVAKKEGILDGFRVVINDGPNGCQSVYHLHLHVPGAGR